MYVASLSFSSQSTHVVLVDTLRHFYDGSLQFHHFLFGWDKRNSKLLYPEAVSETPDTERNFLPVDSEPLTSRNWRTPYFSLKHQWGVGHLGLQPLCRIQWRACHIFTYLAEGKTPGCDMSSSTCAPLIDVLMAWASSNLPYPTIFVVELFGSLDEVFGLR